MGRKHRVSRNLEAHGLLPVELEGLFGFLHHLHNIMVVDYDEVPSLE